MLTFFTEVSKYINVLLMLVFTASGLYAVLNKKITKRCFGNLCAYQRVVIVLFNVQSAALILVSANLFTGDANTSRDNDDVSLVTKTNDVAVYVAGYSA